MPSSYPFQFLCLVFLLWWIPVSFKEPVKSIPEFSSLLILFQDVYEKGDFFFTPYFQFFIFKGPGSQSVTQPGVQWCDHSSLPSWLLGQGDPPTSASQNVGIICMSHSPTSSILFLSFFWNGVLLSPRLEYSGMISATSASWVQAIFLPQRPK